MKRHSPTIYQYQNSLLFSTFRDEKRYTLISDDLKIIKNYEEFQSHKIYNKFFVVVYNIAIVIVFVLFCTLWVLSIPSSSFYSSSCSISPQNAYMSKLFQIPLSEQEEIFNLTLPEIFINIECPFIFLCWISSRRSKKIMFLRRFIYIMSYYMKMLLILYF